MMLSSASLYLECKKARYLGMSRYEIISNFFSYEVSGIAACQETVPEAETENQFERWALT